MRHAHANRNKVKIKMAFTARRPLTLRQAYQQAIRETTTGATHFLVKFLEDKTTSVVSARHIVDPPPSTLKAYSECEVKWSNGRKYKATVLAMGK